MLSCTALIVTVSLRSRLSTNISVGEDNQGCLTLYLLPQPFTSPWSNHYALNYHWLFLKPDPKHICLEPITLDNH